MADYMKKTVAEMKPGDKIESVFSVHYKKPICEYKYGTMFETRVADKTGQITVKYWGDEDSERVQRTYNSLARDAVVSIRGTVADYRGQQELAINPKEGEWIRVLGEGEYDLSELIGSREDIPQLRERVMEYIRSVRDDHLSALLERLFDDEEFVRGFSLCPASIMLHSNEIGGLIYHTLNVADHCMLAWRHYGEMDRDLLLAGALLHDIGKVRAFRVTTNINQTEEGIFLGHPIIGTMMLKSIIETIEGFPEDAKNKLLHIILSHHGKKEWGSPVEPSIPEALAVHYADDYDAKLNYMIVRKETASTEDCWIWDTRMKRHIYLR